MIRFSQYSHRLYHATSAANAQKILASDTLVGQKVDLFDNGPLGVSLTRSFKYAIQFAQDSVNSDDPIILELDADKLRHNYRIVPFNYYSNPTRPAETEFEERVIGDIKNINKYITKIITLSPPGRPVAGNLVLKHPKLYYGRFLRR